MTAYANGRKGATKTAAPVTRSADGPEYFPPSPPGPPPSYAEAQLTASQPRPDLHPDEIPIREYDLPLYDPTQPQSEPPEIIQSDLYGASPRAEHAAQFSSFGQPQNPEQITTHVKKSWSKRLSDWGNKAAHSVNAAVCKFGAEGFLPTTMDDECEKAARILREFCKDGIYAEEAPRCFDGPPTQGSSPTWTTWGSAPTIVDAFEHGSVEQAIARTTSSDSAKMKKPQVLLTIPSKVIARAQGLAILTTVRAGFYVSASTGSGVLIARLPDGDWSPPSGIRVIGLGAGFSFGGDVCDCVVVLNTKEALQAFTRTRISLGSDLAVSAGPWGASGCFEWSVCVPHKKGQERNAPAASDDPHRTTPAPATAVAPLYVAPAASNSLTVPDGEGKDRPSRKTSRAFRDCLQKPIFSYVKSKGVYAGVQVDGTIVQERRDANATFYGAPVTVDQIIKGDVPPGEWRARTTRLVDMLQGAEGWYEKQAREANQPPTPQLLPLAPKVGAVTDGLRSPPVPGAGSANAAEAAAKAMKMEESRRMMEAPPPLFEEVQQGSRRARSDLRPAYVEEEHPRPGGGFVKSEPHHEG